MSANDSLLLVTALNNEPPDDDFATLDFILGTSADEPDDLSPVLDFDPTTNEHAVFTFTLPSSYGGNGIRVALFWTSEGINDNVKWDVAFKRQAVFDNVATRQYAAVQSDVDNMSSTARNMRVASINFTDGAQIDSLDVGDLFKIRVTRDAEDVLDTLNSNDAELLAVELIEAF